VVLDAALPLSLTTAAIALWLVSLPRIDVSGVGDLGLISVLPPEFFLSLALLTASFCLCLRDLPHRRLVALINVGLLILIVFGTTAIVEPEPRIAASWRHAGVIESISRNGAVDPSIDAYFSWPGFFILGAFVADVAGVGSAIAFLMWAPVFFNLLYLPALLMLFKSATDDDRVVWLAVWIFFAANWIGQDYFAPQALNYFLYLVVIAAVVRWFGREGGPAFARDPAASAPLGERSIGRFERAAILAIVIAVLGTIVASHQLTPFAVLVALSALVAIRRCETTRLPILMAVLIGSWSAFMAVAYFKGHLDTLTGHVGALEENVDSSVSGRIRGSPEHLLVLQARLALTGALWGLGFLGAVRAFRRRQLPVTFAVLAMAPFVLMAMQPYGGEMLLRAYLFSLPFTAFFVAKLFYPRRDFGGSWLSTAAVGVIVGTLALGLFVTRYGNERMDFFSQQEVNAVRHVMQTAEPGSLLVAAAPSVPWKFARYEEFEYELLENSALWAQVDPSNPNLRVLVTGLERTLKHPKGGESFFILTRSQQAQLELTGWPPGFFTRFRRALTRSPKFELAYGNRDAAVFVLAREPKRRAAGGHS
jgi:hypothetical protein